VETLGERHNFQYLSYVFDQKVAWIAAKQHGLISRDQIFELRGTPDMIRHRLAAGRWRSVHPGVYAVAGAPVSVAATTMAACLAGGVGSAVSHRSADEIWTAGTLSAPAEVTTTREAGRISTPLTIHRSRDLAPEHVTRQLDLPVTTPARTLVDLGQVAPPWEVSQTLERFLSRELVTMAAVRAAVVVHSRRGRRGVGVLRRVVEWRALGDTPAQSVLEGALADLCRRAGLPRPAYQHEVEIAGRKRRIDFAYPDLMLAIEVDGYEYHSSPTSFEADRIRGNELALAGWQVLHFTWDQVIHRPVYVEGTIRRALMKLGA
jgi:very-short-patch-repair endonuclease